MGRIHPTVDDAVSFHDGTAAPAVRDSVAAHVKSGCASCAAAGVRIRMTLASLRADVLTEVPATTVRAAHDQLPPARHHRHRNAR